MHRRARLGGTAALAVGGLLALGIGCAAVKPVEGDVVEMAAPAPERDGKAEVGKPYFDFSAPELAGGTIRLSALVGPKVVLLQFWGIRCAPCLAEMEFLIGLQKEYGARGLQVVGVNTDRATAAQLREALVARKLDPVYPHVLDPDFAVAEHYTHWPIPVSVLIDREGIVQALHTGYKPELDGVIEAEVKKLVAR